MAQSSNYDEAKDQEIASAEVAQTKYGHIKVSIWSYNNGAPKVQLNRFKRGEGFAKLGRLSKQEFTAIAQCVRGFIEKGKL